MPFTLFNDSIIGGFDLERTNEALRNHALICVTEQRSKEEIDELVAAVKATVAKVGAQHA